MAQPGAGKSSDFVRLQELEKRVIGSIDVATRVMDELSNIANPNKQLIAQLCAAFFQDIKAGQDLVLAGVSASSPERAFEANPYHSLLRTHISAEKVEVVSLHLQEAEQVLTEAGYWPHAGGQNGTNGTAATPAEGGADAAGATQLQQPGDDAQQAGAAVQSMDVT